MKLVGQFYHPSIPFQKGKDEKRVDSTTLLEEIGGNNPITLSTKSTLHASFFIFQPTASRLEYEFDTEVALFNFL